MVSNYRKPQKTQEKVTRWPCLVAEYYLPKLEDIPTIKEWKYVQSKDTVSSTPLSEAFRNKLYDDLVCQIALRSLYELFAADAANALESIVFNGRVQSIDKATGLPFDACILSVQAGKKEFNEINLALVEPRACIKKLKGVASSKLHQLAPVAPILQMDRSDERFVSSYEVAGTLDDSVNLAAMDWEDFEHLIREIFEKEFSVNGGEVKVTQASRDGGVDAVAFDPDPIRGGKIVIQAKRYTNPVGVSAVRDLYGTVMNEGATKGILVTTSHYVPMLTNSQRASRLPYSMGATCCTFLTGMGTERESTSPKQENWRHSVRLTSDPWLDFSSCRSPARFRQAPRSSHLKESGAVTCLMRNSGAGAYHLRSTPIGRATRRGSIPLTWVLLSGLDDSKYLCVWSNIDNNRPDVDDSEGAIDRTSLIPFRGDDKWRGWKCLQESGRVWSKTSGVSTLDDPQKRVSFTH